MNEESLQILLVEDDTKVAYTTAAGLRGSGFQSVICATGREALRRFEKDHVDLIVLDLGLPDLDGLEVLREIRIRSPQIPVLVLTARDAITDRIAGLDAGADDYLVKPFSLPELSARLRALARRVELGRRDALSVEDLSMDVSKRTAVRDGQPLDLSPREFEVLQYLLERQGEVVTRAMLAEDVWHYRSRVTPIDNIIDVQMSRLREKVDKPFDHPLIQTVRGVGFTVGTRP